MPVVRYAALMALVFWLGGTTQTLAGNVYHHMTLVALGSGAVMFVSLFVMKFVGPPPRAFVLRSALVAGMLAATVATSLYGQSPFAHGAALVVGLILLSWYAHE